MADVADRESGGNHFSGITLVAGGGGVASRRRLAPDLAADLGLASIAGILVAMKIPLCGWDSLFMPCMVRPTPGKVLVVEVISTKDQLCNSFSSSGDRSRSRNRFVTAGTL